MSGDDAFTAAGVARARARMTRPSMLAGDPEKLLDAFPDGVRIDSGAALLVCAYDTPEKFRRNHLQGALSLDQLRDREASLAKEQEIIFYCA